MLYYSQLIRKQHFFANPPLPVVERILVPPPGALDLFIFIISERSATMKFSVSNRTGKDLFFDDPEVLWHRGNQNALLVFQNVLIMVFFKSLVSEPVADCVSWSSNFQINYSAYPYGKNIKDERGRKVATYDTDKRVVVIPCRPLGGPCETAFFWLTEDPVDFAASLI